MTPLRISDIKYCSRGKHHVPRADFAANINTFDGLQTWCRKCMKAYRHDQAEAHRRVLAAKAQAEAVA